MRWMLVEFQADVLPEAPSYYALASDAMPDADEQPSIAIEHAGPVLRVNTGVAVIDVATAQVGFPTIVNNKLAFFSWLPGEETVSHWHYDNDFDHRRPVPEAWYQPLPVRTSLRRKG